jgi:hypothetical protein
LRKEDFSVILSVREAWRRLRAPYAPQAEPDWLSEVLKSLRWMHQEHVKSLRELGYSPKEAFWLDFACLPFLPWEGAQGSEMPLSRLLWLYADLYRSTADSLDPADEPAFVELLRQRYHRMRQVVAAAPEPPSDGALDPAPAGAPGRPTKWALGGLIVLWTARAWQTHPAGFPCRLLEDL